MFQSFKQRYIVNFWDVGKAMVALGVLSAVYFGVLGGVWAVTGEMTRWGGEFLELFGFDTSPYSYYKIQNLNGTPLTRTDGVMLIGMFIGALVAALWANKVKFRLPASGVRVFQAIVGGFLSGFGARLAFGCNLADFFTGLPYFSLHTWLFTIFMVLGIYLGVKLCSTPFFKPKAPLIRVDNETGLGIVRDKSRAARHSLFGSLVFIAFLGWVCYLIATNPALDVKVRASLLSVALIFGFAFGFIISKGQVCFTSCFRDLFLFGREIALKGAIIGMILATLIAFAFMMWGHSAKVVDVSLAVAVGAFLFGFGIVFAGGCECGWAYRACEGQVHFMIVGLANVLGTIVLALTYDLMPQGFKQGVKVQLLQEFTPLGGLFITLAMFSVCLFLGFYFKKRFFEKRALAGSA